MSEVKKDFYQEVANVNEGVQAKNVKSIFWWYDLLSFAIAFQLIYIASCALNVNFSVTIFSTIAVIVTDTLIKISLMNDGKNYQKLKSQLALVKLWTIPLVVLSIAIVTLLVLVAFGLI